MSFNTEVFALNSTSLTLLGKTFLASEQKAFDLILMREKKIYSRLIRSRIFMADSAILKWVELQYANFLLFMENKNMKDMIYTQIKHTTPNIKAGLSYDQLS